MTPEQADAASRGLALDMIADVEQRALVLLERAGVATGVTGYTAVELAAFKAGVDAGWAATFEILIDRGLLRCAAVPDRQPLDFGAEP